MTRNGFDHKCTLRLAPKEVLKALGFRARECAQTHWSLSCRMMSRPVTWKRQEHDPQEQRSIHNVSHLTLYSLMMSDVVYLPYTTGEKCLLCKCLQLSSPLWPLMYVYLNVYIYIINIIHILSPSYAPVLLSSMHTVGLTIRQQGAFLVAKCAQKFLRWANAALQKQPKTLWQASVSGVSEKSGSGFGMVLTVLTNNFTYFHIVLQIITAQVYVGADSACLSYLFQPRALFRTGVPTENLKGRKPCHPENDLNSGF